MPDDQLKRFAALVLSVWVSAEAARTIVPTARAPEVMVVKATAVRGEEPAMALTAYERAFRRALNVPVNRPRSREEAPHALNAMMPTKTTWRKISQSAYA